ncbi:MAG: sulfotransferase domain-containing protein [Alcanivoracaceae bacterium]|nr:sulfotransferase domain-containing protein [Alcanivoracaceae bacterium]
MEKKVNFFIVGAPKCGTTTVADALSSHPDAFIPDVKEPHYFCTDWPAFQRYTTLSSYMGLFSEGKFNGDASVWYLYSKAAPLKIHDYNPDAKIIVCLREPQTMIPSLHNQLFFSGRDPEKVFDLAWNRPLSKLMDLDEKKCLVREHLNYKDIGNFYPHVRRWSEIFGENNIKVVFLDELKERPQEVFSELLGFLGLSGRKLEVIKSNPAREHRFYGLSMFIMRPPFPLNHVKRLARRLFADEGRSYLRGLYSFLSREKVVSTISPQVAREVRDAFADDWHLVNEEFRK